MSIGTLTVYFEEPFWVGIFERVEDGMLSACKITFGAEPKDYEVWAFILRHYDTLHFGPPIETERSACMAENPKRRQRSVKKQLQTAGVGTKSQQALAAQREAQKTAREKAHKQQRQAEQARKFAQKQLKRKEKHKGH